ncbi:tyrosine-protein phosphatase YwqE [Allocatelliglobosispora scoriae]|uniref:Tyrosine-protein phosphatase YwqE n=1 Tax=Allocatelliglobosispora scoriae TaxID=643052 RepID=A0A841BWU8_9ACTN|nr:hypothetical protein [Allocatelliglobosispora scoriae]MBB5871968.1 tyrosine-protein phosphatase YwqE [Allocatelliglobosispora scoriae]
MVDATANQSNGMYDGQATERPAIYNVNDRSVNDPTDSGISFRLEIVAVSGREGEKLQAIQARAIREALLWAIEQRAHNTNPGEGK